MNIDMYIKAIDNQSLLESKGNLLKSIKPLLSMTWKKAVGKMKQSFTLLAQEMKEQGKEKDILHILNRHLNTNYKSLTDIQKQSIKEGVVNEGMGDWWSEAKGNFYGAISFYPLLTAFIELDKVIKGVSGASPKYVLSYALIWAFIVSGKVILSKGSEKKPTKKKMDDVGKAYSEM